MTDLNNVDEFIFDNSMADTSGMNSNKFLKKYVAEIKDTNGARDYSNNQVVFDGSSVSMSGSYCDLKNTILEIPTLCTVSMRQNGAAVNMTVAGNELDFLCALKNGINAFDSFIVEYNGITVVSQTAYLNAYLNMRLNTEMSLADEALHGDTFNYHKDNSSSWTYSDAAGVSGRGLCNNRNSFYKVDTCAGNIDEVFNEGMAKRQQKMNRISDAGNVFTRNGRDKLMTADAFKTYNLDYVEHTTLHMTYYYTILIRFSDLIFFKELPLIRNASLKLTFNINQGGVVVSKSVAVPGASAWNATGGLLDFVSYSGNSNTFPIMIGAGNIDVKTTATNVIRVAVGADATYPVAGIGGTGNTGVSDTIVACGSSNVPITDAHDTFIYITYSVIKNNSTLDNQSALNLQHKKSQCTLYIPTYIMTPQSEAIYQSVREKKIPFLNVISGRIDNVLPGQSFEKILVQSIARVQRVILIPYLSGNNAGGNGTNAAGNGNPFSCWISPFDSAPATTSPVASFIQNLQLTVASTIGVYQNPVMFSMNHYLNELAGQQSLNFGQVMGASTSTLSLKDYQNCYGYIICNMQRRRVDDYAVPISIQCNGYNNCLKTLQIYYYIEYMDESFVIDPNSSQKLVSS